MSKQHEPGRSRRLPDESGTGPRPAQRKLALSGLVQRALITFKEREEQRRGLLNILILAQALLVLASAPGYVGLPPSVPGAVVVGLALLAYLSAWVLNQVFHDVARAAYMLLAGGGTAVLALVFVLALTGDFVAAGQASLLLLPVILEAGLLFAPEMILIAAPTLVLLSAVALLLALALGPAQPRREIYLLVVDVLGLQVVGALVAWMLAQFVYDTATEAQRTQEMQFAQARLAAQSGQALDRQRRLEEGLRGIQLAIGHALDGDLTARATTADSGLGAVGESLNALLARMEALVHAYSARQRVEASANSLIDGAGRLTEATPGAPAGALPAGGAFGTEAAGQMRVNLGRRLGRVEALAAEVTGALAHSQEGLNSTALTATETLRTVGAALSAGDGMLVTAQREMDLIARIRRALASALPADAAGGTSGDLPPRDANALDPSSAAALLGLGPDLGVGAPGMTGEFDIVGTLDGTDEADGTDTPNEVIGANGASGSLPESMAAPPTTVEPAGEGDVTTRASGARRRRKAGDAATAARIAEMWLLLNQLADESGRQERAAGTLTHELGLVNRHARGVDIGIAWARQALEAVRRNAEKLHQVAGASLALPLPADSEPITPTVLPDLIPRRPAATLPLGDTRMPAGDLADMDLAAAATGERGERASAMDSTATDSTATDPPATDTPVAGVLEVPAAPESLSAEAKTSAGDSVDPAADAQATAE